MATLSPIKQARLFEGCAITRQTAIDSAVNLIVKGRDRYEQIGAKLDIPWYLIGVFHYRESTCNFAKHLHNGDPLTRRTRLVPAGRPLTGTPPFTFEESAEDALGMKNLDGMGDVSIGNLLVILEKYNGLGYAFKGKPSPYVWAGTDVYSSGKYVADRVYDANVVDKQNGTGAILLRMHERGIITLRGEAVAVVVDDKTIDARGFIIRGVSYVGVRAITTALGGTITDVEDGVALVAKNGKAQGFKMAVIDGTGYVKARELVTWLGASISYDQGAQALEIASGKSVKK